MIEQLRLKYPVPLMCHIFDGSSSGYYRWRKQPVSRRAQEEARLEVEILAAHKRTRKTCGPERLQEDLASYGVKISRVRLRNCM